MNNLNFTFAFYRKIQPIEFEIIQYLTANNNEFYGSYRELSAALNKPLSQATNLCKRIHSLENKGYLFVAVDEVVRNKRKTRIALNPDWQELILKED